MIYLLDANVFIQAKNLHYGLDFCPAFWDWMIRQNAAGSVFSIEKVGDEQRLRLMAGLGEQEVCVCQLTELLGLAPSTVSKHLSILQQAGLIVGRKEGRWVHYRLAGRESPSLVRETLAWLRKVMRGNNDAARVRGSLAAILKMDPEELCRRQSGRA